MTRSFENSRSRRKVGPIPHGLIPANRENPDKKEKQIASLNQCYKMPMGPSIDTNWYQYKEYKPTPYQSRHHVYEPRDSLYINRKLDLYDGSVEYVLSKDNFYPINNTKTMATTKENGFDDVVVTKKPLKTKAKQTTEDPRNNSRTPSPEVVPRAPVAVAAVASKPLLSTTPVQKESQSSKPTQHYPPETVRRPPVIMTEAFTNIDRLPENRISFIHGPQMWKTGLSTDKNKLPENRNSFNHATQMWKSRLPPEVLAGMNAYRTLHAK